MKKYVLMTLVIFWGTWAHAQNISIRTFPAPETVSAEMLPLVTGKPTPFWNDHPKTAEEWKSWVGQIAQRAVKRLPDLREQMQVSVESAQFGGVQGFIITPKQILPENRERILIHFHGGGYVLNPGEAGTDEAIMMAGYG